MITKKILKGDKLTLRIIELEDCNETYLSWLQDTEINQYLETRWQEQTLDTIKDFVKQTRESTHSYLFAIIFKNKHIGNIKIGPIHPIYKFADVSYFIGDKSTWGQGIATEAIKLILDFSFNELNLHKVSASAFEENIASLKALEKNKFIKEGILRNHQFLKTGDNYTNIHKYGLLKTEYNNNYNSQLT